MIRYRYVTSLHPPAPFVNVSVGCPTTGASAKDLPAQIEEPYVLLGRDVLNSYRLLLDGPELAVEIEIPQE